VVQTQRQEKAIQKRAHAHAQRAAGRGPPRDAGQQPFRPIPAEAEHDPRGTRAESGQDGDQARPLEKGERGTKLDVLIPPAQVRGQQPHQYSGENAHTDPRPRFAVGRLRNLHQDRGEDVVAHGGGQPRHRGVGGEGDGHADREQEGKVPEDGLPALHQPHEVGMQAQAASQERQNLRLSQAQDERRRGQEGNGKKERASDAGQEARHRNGGRSGEEPLLGGSGFDRGGYGGSALARVVDKTLDLPQRPVTVFLDE
jgi:hypothetical protein